MVEHQTPNAGMIPFKDECSEFDYFEQSVQTNIDAYRWLNSVLEKTLAPPFELRISDFGFPYHSSTGTMRLAMM